MSVSTITIAGQSITLVSLPTSRGPKMVEWKLHDTVGRVRSIFTGQSQRQQWPGADMLSGTITLPKLTQLQADDWQAFFAECRGTLNAFLIGDPLKTSPNGSVAGTPLIDNTVAGGNAAMSLTLGIKGFTSSAARVLARNDWIQIGYRRHMITTDVNADGSGKATVPIWPSIREVPTDGGAVITTNPLGLMSLAENDRGWSAEETRLTSISFAIQEYR